MIARDEHTNISNSTRFVCPTYNQHYWTKHSTTNQKHRTQCELATKLSNILQTHKDNLKQPLLSTQNETSAAQENKIYEPGKTNVINNNLSISIPFFTYNKYLTEALLTLLHNFQILINPTT